MPKALSGLMGMRHIALNVKDVERSKIFYQNVLGMEVVWQPDPQNAYLSSGPDNLALHESPEGRAPNAATSSLDHLGFIVSDIDRVQELEAEFRAQQVTIIKPFKRHRDGSASFYCADPDGVVIQMLYEPTLSRQRIGDG
ncbi:MAG: VOC family protein [Deltaproteobacteria bacterium]|nr:VOC family protein [Deltaproteobacteria bacterium]